MMMIIILIIIVDVLNCASIPSNKKKFFNKLPDLSQKEFPKIPDNYVYDIIVLGSGVAGEAIAVRSAQLRRKVGIIERKSSFGGPTGLTSKAVREAAKRISNVLDASSSSGSERRIQTRSLWKKLFPVLKTEAEVLQAKESRERLTNNNVDIFIGNAEFSNRKYTLTELKDERNSVIRVCRPNECIEIETQNVCIATGSRPNRPNDIKGVSIPWEVGKVVCSSEIANLPVLPNAIVIYGGGVIAVEYATVFATLGVGVTLICREENFLPFLEKELRESLKNNMRKNHVLFLDDDDDIEAISIDKNFQGDSSVRVKVSSKYMKSGKEVVRSRVFKVDIFLYSGGRDSNSDNLGLEHVDVSIGKYGRVVVDSKFKATSKFGIYAVGDVIGPPMLASSAQAQARRVAERLFAQEEDMMMTLTSVDTSVDESSDMDLEVDEFFSPNNEKGSDDTLFGDLTGDKVNDAPLTLWSIPEISSVGVTFESAVASNNHADNIFQGYAYFRDTARGRLSGTADGYLKIVSKQVSSSSHVIVGVHIYGEGANELIQMGALLIHSKTTLQQVSKTPFAAVTMTGLFQIACDDILRQVRDKKGGKESK